MNGASPTSERRLARRFLQYWQERRGDRKFPSLADIDPEAIGDMSPSCFILDTVGNPEFPYLRYLGSDLLKYSGIFLSAKTELALTLLDKAASNFREAVEMRVPIQIEDELTRFDGSRLLFRSVLLPLSEDQKTVDSLLGVVNGIVRHDVVGRSDAPAGDVSSPIEACESWA